MEQMKKFFALMQQDEGLNEKVRALDNLEPEAAKKELIALAAEQGIELTPEELEVGRELSDEEVELIAGGGLHDDEGYLLTTYGYSCKHHLLQSGNPLHKVCSNCKYWKVENPFHVLGTMVGVPGQCTHPANRTTPKK